MKRISIISFIVILLSLTSGPSYACSCPGKPPPSADLSSASTEQSLIDRIRALFD